MAIAAAVVIGCAACGGSPATTTPLSSAAARSAARSAWAGALAPGSRLLLQATLQVNTASLSQVAQRDVISLAPFLNTEQLVATVHPTSVRTAVVAATLTPACPSPTTVTLDLPSASALASLPQGSATGVHSASGDDISLRGRPAVLTQWLTAALPATLAPALRVTAGNFTLGLGPTGHFRILSGVVTASLSVTALWRAETSGGVPLAGSSSSFPAGTATLRVSLSVRPGAAALHCPA